ncbi:hypothetical protein [Pedobacter sp. Leaf250]|uniref:hypothetical protein n=1 Tax=Pedobacter sp. Leaf250 TaxID=2876559 RepID=UPI001E56F14B|nr:hypothetical protein [Pedobacter sp. Leaf250]
MLPIVLEARVKNLIQTEAEWLAEDPEILDGEIAYVRFGNFVNTKAGNGSKRFSELQYNLEKPAQPVGVLKPSDQPGPANAPRFWFAEKGIYPNLGLEVTGNAGVIIDNGASYSVANFNIDLTSYPKFSDLDPILHELEIKNESLITPAVYQVSSLEDRLLTTAHPNPNNKGWGYGLLKNQFSGLFNLISSYLYCRTPGQKVTMYIYATSDDFALWKPDSAGTNLVLKREFLNFNTNKEKRFECLLDEAIEIPKDKLLFIYFESLTSDLMIFRHENDYAGVKTDLLEFRNPKTYYYLDLSGYQTQFPVLTLVSKYEYLSKKEDQTAFDDKIVLLDTIYAVVGKEMNLYKNNILDIYNGNESYEVILTNTTSDWTSATDNSGITLNDRSIKFKPTVPGQSFSFECRVRDVNRKQLGIKKFQIKTVSKNAGNGTKYFVFAGNSLTEGGEGYNALLTYKSIMADGGISPVFVGSKVNDKNSEVKHEGYSGKTFGFFLTEGSPFFFNGEINFKAYAASKNVPRLDMLVIQDGINDVLANIFYDNMSQIIAPTINALTQLIDILLSPEKGFPDCKVIISAEPFGANGEGDIASKNSSELKRKMMALNRAIINKFYQNDSGSRFHPNVWVSPSFELIDRDFGYPHSYVRVCEYATVKISDNETIEFTEKHFTDTIHPNPYGQEQISNCNYSLIRRVLQ